MAEFLIKARDQVDLPKDKEKRDRCYRRGDIVVVMPDGHKWGKEERLPKFVIVKIPKMTVEEGTKFIESAYVDTGIYDPDNRMIRKLVHKRVYRIDLDHLPKGTLSKEGVAEVSWDNIKGFVYNKIEARTE